MTGMSLGAPGLRLAGRDREPDLRSETAVTGFVGIAERGPLHDPQPVSGWEQFVQIFGDIIDYGDLAEAVFAFFLNGGEKCWCVRVADPRDRSDENTPGQCPSVELLRSAADVPLLDRTGQSTVRVEAINQGAWGNRIRYEVLPIGGQDLELTRLRQPIQAADTVLPVDNAIDFAPGMPVRVNHAANPFVQRTVTVSSADPAASTITISSPLGESFSAGSHLFGRGFTIVTRCGDRTEVFADLVMNEAHERYFARVVNGDGEAGEYVTRIRRGNSILIRVEHVKNGGPSRFKPEAATRRLSGGGDGFTLAEAVLLNGSDNPALRVVATADKGRSGNGIRVTADRFGTSIALAVPLTTGERNRFSTPDARFFRVGETARIRHAETSSVTETRAVVSVEPDGFVHLASDLTNDYPIGSTASVAGRFDLAVFGIDDTTPRERFRNLRTTSPTSDGYVKAELAAHSELICADPVSPPSVPRDRATLDGGVDPGEIDYRYYTGYEEDGRYFEPAGGSSPERYGLATLERVGEVSLIAVPDLSRGVTPERDDFAIGAYDFATAQKLILAHCAKLGERMALLELEPDATLDVAAGWPATFGEEDFAKYGALFYPWMKRSGGDPNRWVPPCGAVAGAFSRSDQLHGVGKAPANLPLIGVVATRVDLDRAEQEGLNPLGVNCIRKLAVGKVNLMGSRTLAPRLNTRYVNARRVLLSIVKTLSRKMLWAVFEPNGPALWKRIESTLSVYLTSLVSRGVMAGANPAESFFVQCDAETNPEESTAAGRVVARIGVALIAPAEFIVITARRTPESLNIIEEET
jgi:hypothetical protein